MPGREYVVDADTPISWPYRERAPKKSILISYVFFKVPGVCFTNVWQLGLGMGVTASTSFHG